MSLGRRHGCLLACALLGLGGGACDPNFDPDWHLPQPRDFPDSSLDAGIPVPTPLDDAGQDAGALPGDDAALDAGGAPDGGLFWPAPECSLLVSCVDAGPDCKPKCVAPCDEIPCIQGTLCLKTGICAAECSTCAGFPIK
jgi:hypothetical protein